MIPVVAGSSPVTHPTKPGRRGVVPLNGPRGTPVPALTGSVLIAAVGGLMVSRGPDDLAIVACGIALVIIGVSSLALAGLRAWAARGSSARLQIGADGAPATSVQASAFAVVLPLTALAAVTAASSTCGWVAWRDENPLLGVALGLFALLTLVALVVPVVRGAGADRVDLAPASIAVEHFGRCIVVPREAFLGCMPPDGARPMALMLRDGAHPTIRSRRWPMWQQPRTPRAVEAVVVRDLRVRPDLLARLVTLCVEDPAMRASLGTEQSLDWLTAPPGHDQGARRLETP